MSWQRTKSEEVSRSVTFNRRHWRREADGGTFLVERPWAKTPVCHTWRMVRGPTMAMAKWAQLCSQDCSMERKLTKVTRWRKPTSPYIIYVSLILYIGWKLFQQWNKSLYSITIMNNSPISSYFERQHLTWKYICVCVYTYTYIHIHIYL